MYNENANLYEPYQGFIRGNMFQNLFSPYGKVYDIKPLNEQAELLTYLNMLDFACIDLDLYLDVFPEDQKMITLYNKLLKEKNNIMNKYEDNFGPLTLNSDTLENTPWTWIICPWPWEG